MASDDFNTSNGTALEDWEDNADWTSIDGTRVVTNLEIQGNLAQHEGTYDTSGAYNNNSAAEDSQIVSKAHDDDVKHVACRCDTNERGYSVFLGNGGGGVWTCFYVNKSGAYHDTLEVAGTWSQAADHTIRITTSGVGTVTIEGWVNGVSQGTSNDSSSPISGPGHPGFFTNSIATIANSGFDDWTDGTAQVYYSVSPYDTGDQQTEVTDLEVTITDGVAVLTDSGGAGGNGVQTGNIGVGVAIEYNSTVCYISGVTNAYTFDVVTAIGETPGDQAATDVTSIHHVWELLADAEAAWTGASFVNNASLVAANVVLNIACYADHVDQDPDSTSVDIDGTTTDPTRYIKIYCPNSSSECISDEVGRGFYQRHAGKEGANEYMITSTSNTIDIIDNDVQIIGLRIESTSSYDRALIIGGGAPNILVDKCLITSNGASNSFGIMIDNDCDTGTVTIQNSIVYGAASGGDCIRLNDSDVTLYCYNCTIADGNRYGIAQIAGTAVATNCLFVDIAVGEVSGLTPTYSAGAEAWASGGTGNIQWTDTPTDWTNVFNDYANDDYSLKGYTSTRAIIDQGTDLSGSGVGTDIVGNARSTWDMGAFERETKDVYYSVSPYGTASIEAGAGTITIVNGVATLSADQAGENIGVGVAIEYDTTEVVYISGVTSSTVFDVVTALGEIPLDQAAIAVDSIHHVWGGLATAEGACTGANFINNSSLIAADVVLHIACYADHDAQDPDDTRVYFDAITSGADATRYLHIYTPLSADCVTDQVTDRGQRHDGAWNDNAYKLVDPITQNNVTVLTSLAIYTRIEGLQVKGSGTYNGTLNGIYDGRGGSGNLQVGYCIVVDDNQGSGAGHGFYTTRPGFEIYNSIIYDWATDGIYSATWNSGTTDVYNSTIYNCATGMADSGQGNELNAYNCAVFNCTDDFNANVNTVDYCASDDGDGTNEVDWDAGATDWAANFTAYGSGDFSIKDTDADIYDAGDATAGGSLYADDIIGTTRTVWSIGAFEDADAPAGGGVTIPVFMHHYTKNIGAR